MNEMMNQILRSSEFLRGRTNRLELHQQNDFQDIIDNLNAIFKPISVLFGNLIKHDF